MECGGKGHGRDEECAFRAASGPEEVGRGTREDNRVRYTCDRLRISQTESDRRILLELNTSEDPTWVFLDAQHRFALEKLSDIHKTTSARVEGETSRTRRLGWSIYSVLDTQRNMEPATLDIAEIAIVVVPQLRAGVASIDSKQPETIISE